MLAGGLGEGKKWVQGEGVRGERAGEEGEESEWKKTLELVNERN